METKTNSIHGCVGQVSLFSVIPSMCVNVNGCVDVLVYFVCVCVCVNCTVLFTQSVQVLFVYLSTSNRAVMALMNSVPASNRQVCTAKYKATQQPQHLHYIYSNFWPRPKNLSQRVCVKKKKRQKYTDLRPVTVLNK